MSKADWGLAGSDPNMVTKYATAIRRGGGVVHTQFGGSLRKQLRKASSEANNVVNLDNEDERATLASFL